MNTSYSIRLVMVAVLSLLASDLVLAHGPSRQKVTKEVSVNAPADKVWALVADFCAIETWHPAVAKCTGTGGNDIGATRVLAIGAEDGPTIHEELQKYDAEKMKYKYKITKTDNAVAPVTTYSSFLSVKDAGDGTSIVQWKGGFYRAYPNNNPPTGIERRGRRNGCHLNLRGRLSIDKRIGGKVADCRL